MHRKRIWRFDSDIHFFAAGANKICTARLYSSAKLFSVHDFVNPLKAGKNASKSFPEIHSGNSSNTSLANESGVIASFSVERLSLRVK